MKNIEVTMTKRLCFDFKATNKEIRMLQDGDVPKRMQKEIDKANWIEGWQEYAVYDRDKEEQIVDWD